ncbi:MAG: hypothetical protein EOO04_00585 [Chitinophagaceae bacterium]|nr:MAG: hypothetical protein EOO04_00585 [Chitinophagaceae bacterium]
MRQILISWLFIFSNITLLCAEGSRCICNCATPSNVFNIGLFISASTATVPAEAAIIQTSGYSIVGIGSAKYIRTNRSGATPFRFQTKDNQWWELSEDFLHVDMFGAIGDATTDNTPAIQAAIDFAAAGGQFRHGQGATIWITNGVYVSNQLTIRSGTYLTGGNRATGKGGFSAASSSGGALKAGAAIAADSFLISSAHNAKGWGINGLQLIGTGAASKSGGIKINGGGDWMITNNTLKDWGIEAITGHGTPFVVSYNMVQGLNNRPYLVSKGQPTGAIKLWGVDGTLDHNEFTGSANLDGSQSFKVSGKDLFLGAAYFRGLTLSQLSFNIYQVADAGLLHPGDFNNYISERFDTNAGHGMYLRWGGSNNIFISPKIERNSLAQNNLYDGIAVSSGGRNKFVNPTFFAGSPVGSVTYNMRYYINDTKTDYKHNFVNHYESPRVFTKPGTGYAVLGNPDAAARISFASDGPLRVTGETPDVWGNLFLKTYNAQPTTISNFLNGVPGQIITVIDDPSAGAVTKVKHGENIRLRAGTGTLTLNQDIAIQFINKGSINSPIWVQLNN